jgi:hypothetical protein
MHFRFNPRCACGCPQLFHKFLVANTGLPDGRIFGPKNSKEAPKNCPWPEKIKRSLKKLFYTALVKKQIFFKFLATLAEKVRDNLATVVTSKYMDAAGAPLAMISSQAKRITAKLEYLTFANEKDIFKRINMLCVGQKCVNNAMKS